MLRPRPHRRHTLTTKAAVCQQRVCTVVGAVQLHSIFTCLERQKKIHIYEMCYRNRSIRQISLYCNGS